MNNATLSEEMQKEKNDNVTLVQKVALLERKYEDATASATSSSFSKSSQEEFEYFSIKTNKKHYDLVCELFKTLVDIFETHMVFDKMFVVLEELIEKR